MCSAPVETETLSGALTRPGKRGERRGETNPEHNRPAARARVAEFNLQFWPTGCRKWLKAQLATCDPCLRATVSAKRKWMPK